MPHGRARCNTNPKLVVYLMQREPGAPAIKWDAYKTHRIYEGWLGTCVCMRSGFAGGGEAEAQRVCKMLATEGGGSQRTSASSNETSQAKRSTPVSTGVVKRSSFSSAFSLPSFAPPPSFSASAPFSPPLFWSALPPSASTSPVPAPGSQGSCPVP